MSQSTALPAFFFRKAMLITAGVLCLADGTLLSLRTGEPQHVLLAVRAWWASPKGVQVSSPDPAAQHADELAEATLAAVTHAQLQVRLSTPRYAENLDALKRYAPPGGFSADVTLKIHSAGENSYCASATAKNGSGATYYATPLTGVSQVPCAQHVL